MPMVEVSNGGTPDNFELISMVPAQRDAWPYFQKEFLTKYNYFMLTPISGTWSYLRALEGNSLALITNLSINVKYPIGQIVGQENIVAITLYNSSSSSAQMRIKLTTE